MLVYGLHGDLSGLPPAWIGVGTRDLFHDECRAYGERLRQATGEAGFIARLGGDEFTVVFHFSGEVAEIDRRAGALVSLFQQPLVIDRREIADSDRVKAERRRPFLDARREVQGVERGLAPVG